MPSKPPHPFGNRGFRRSRLKEAADNFTEQFRQAGYSRKAARIHGKRAAKKALQGGEHDADTAGS